MAKAMRKYFRENLDGTETTNIYSSKSLEAQVFISYKRLLTRCLYEPFPPLIYASIYFRVLNPCVYLGPGIYMSPAFIQINMVYM